MRITENVLVLVLAVLAAVYMSALFIVPDLDEPASSIERPY